MSKAGICRQATRLAKLPNPKERLAALDRIATILERAVARDVLQQLDRQPICPRCSEPFKQWRHSRVNGEPICEPCFATEEEPTQ